MRNKQSTSFFKLLSLAGVAVALTACSSDPAPWAKKNSPWDQRRSNTVEAPAADSYKSDLGMPGEDMPPVELSYEPAGAESYVPVDPEPVIAAPEPMPEPAPVIVEETVVPMTNSIRDFPANYYTVQLMASVDVDRVYRFAQKYQIPTKYIVPTVRDGVTWHVLLLDVYPDRKTATAGKNDIAPLLTTQPWVRSVGSVQQLMK